MLKRRLKLTKEDKEWASKVKERDGNKCIVCGNDNMLNAHHIIPREVKEFKLELDNGLSLCPNHHFFSRKISAHNNPIGLFFWMELNKPEQLMKIREMMKYVNS